jgi:solute carrier family 25 carnitine/acylcarnitine transporter 20/29
MQPFEIVKVRLANQSLLNPTCNKIIGWARQIYREESLLAFYKGAMSPLLGIGGLVSLHFGTNELIRKIIAKLHIPN